MSDVDDLDRILNEFSECCVNVENKTNNSKKHEDMKMKSKSKGDSKRMSEDLSEILKEISLDIDNEVGTATKRSCSANVIKAKSVQKCSNPMVGGTDIPITELHSLKLCNRLRCLSCDLPVIFIDGFQWTDKVDYIFLRTNYPEVSKLHSRLTSCRPNRAYACQCSSLNVNSLNALKEFSNIKWICSGH